MDSVSNDRFLKWLVLPATSKAVIACNSLFWGEAANHHGSDSENNRARTMFIFGFTAGVAFAFGATAYAYRLVKQIPANTTQR